MRCMHCGGVLVGGQGIPCRGPPQRISAAGVGSSPAPAPAGRARVRAGPGMRSRTCHVRSCYSFFFVCGVLHVSVGADTASAWRRPNVLWSLDLHTVYRGDAKERRHSACPPNQAPHKVCLMFFRCSSVLLCNWRWALNCRGGRCGLSSMGMWPERLLGGQTHTQLHVVYLLTRQGIQWGLLV